MRLVLDSNVWLDWLIFDDPRVAGLKRAKADASIEIVIDDACRDELVRVLAYKQFALDVAEQAALLEHVDRLTTLLSDLRYPSVDALPWCADADDVKFLALSAASDADWLVTKDKALLSGRRRKRATQARFRIATPEQWAHALLDEPFV